MEMYAFGLRQNKPNQTQFLKIPDNFSSQLEIIIEVFQLAIVTVVTCRIFPLRIDFDSLDARRSAKQNFSSL